MRKPSKQPEMYENTQKHVLAFKPRISSLSINMEKNLELNTTEKSNKQTTEKCPLNLVTKQPLVTLMRAVSLKCWVQEPNCNSLKRKWMETTSVKNSFKKFCSKQ